MIDFSEWCDFHDWTLDRFVLDSRETRIEFEFVSPHKDQRAVVEFLGVRDLQLVDLALDTIIDEIKEIEFDDLSRVADGLRTATNPPGGPDIGFSSRYKWSIYESIKRFGEKEQLHLWVILPCFGLLGAILGREIQVRPLPLATSSPES